jgi:hypothetical protein
MFWADEPDGDWFWLVPDCAWVNGTASRLATASITSLVLIEPRLCSKFIKEVTLLAGDGKRIFCSWDANPALFGASNATGLD